MLWDTRYRNVSEGDGKTLEARYNLLFSILINKMWLQIPPRKKKKQNKLQRCPAKPSTQTLFEVRSRTSSSPLDFQKSRLLCSGSCVPRNVNRKDICGYKPRNSNRLVGKHTEGVFLLPLLLQTNMRNPHFKVRGQHFKQQFPHHCSLDSIWRSSWGRWRLPKKMPWRLISELRGATISGKSKKDVFFHLNYHRPQWRVNLRSKLSAKGLLKINLTDKQTT